MRILSSNNEAILFDSHLIRIIVQATGKMDSSKTKVSQRVEDASGNDITDKARTYGITNAMQRSWVEMSLDLPGFDGRFCVPQLEFSLMGL